SCRHYPLPRRPPPPSTLFPYTTLFRSPTNVEYLSDHVGQDDFVVVTEARRVGGITDVADLTVMEPLLLMSRPHGANWGVVIDNRSEEHTSELQSRENLVCRLLLEKKKR